LPAHTGSTVRGIGTVRQADAGRKVIRHPSRPLHCRVADEVAKASASNDEARHEVVVSGILLQVLILERRGLTLAEENDGVSSVSVSGTVVKTVSRLPSPALGNRCVTRRPPDLRRGLSISRGHVGRTEAVR